ncbi:NADP-dependent isocitrate dehydrogenase [Psychroflexus sp. CAK57W]|uniref:NADP-dependent isocitrate dehydrogenase n=1 Tax=Psychroflexus curvus TaxID=2873595 RepID=UPI001CCFFD1B|nr:NADP-dependent isocitrate dehydrogenase [Psychroflexus curvus]MBZ9788041.1 NADP-dependent isocitrate dehydrogenase [Psychroflexus curvus]
MGDHSTKIIYTKTDEAPALATYSFLPIVRRFTETADIKITSKDISLAARILSNFDDYLTDDQKVEDNLAYLGKLAKTPEANIIKLPNISASVPQLTAAIKELQDKGYKVPDYPESPKNSDEEKVQKRYAKVLGSAVNPVLREGNSDRRVAQPVKEYAQDHPHKLAEWSDDSKSHVSAMSEGDFYGSEKSVVLQHEDDVKIVHVDKDGKSIVLKESTPLEKDEVIDASVMNAKALRTFLTDEIKDAKEKNVLFSIHLKATMMKVSDPVIFGHAVTVFFEEVFNKYEAEFKEIGVDPTNGLGDVYNKISQLPEEKSKAILSDLEAIYEKKADLAMVDSSKGITNLHVPSDVIIDASMPAALKSGGKMWNKNDKTQDMKAVIPDRSYAGIYQQVIEFCQKHGAFDVTTMGNVSNVGLMAKKAEEYGSHDKTFIIPKEGRVDVLNAEGHALLSHEVEEGDIWRMCQTKDLPIKDWVGLAVKRAKNTGQPAIFWLDENRAHDTNLIKKVKTYLEDYDLSGLDIQIMNPKEAMQYTLERVKAGKDTISVTGNVLRDYLTDLFPILELGTSAKMLSIVPLLAGGGLYETGAGGSAPKHVQQFVKEGHLRWDSLGEFLALAVSIEDIADKTNNERAKVIAKTLNKANSQYLKNDKSPSRKVNEIDNRGTHFYLALYWAKALAEQNEDSVLKSEFEKVANYLEENEGKINEELLKAQGNPQDIKGYFFPDEDIVTQRMRPSATLNSIIDRK